MPGMYPWAYNTAPCPKRTDGGSHETAEQYPNMCQFCRVRIVAVTTPRKAVPSVPEVQKVVDEVRRPEVARRGDWPRLARVPQYLKAEYYAVRNKLKCDDEYAQGFVAMLHGLEPGGRDTWTLQQVARLEFLKWLAQRDKYGH